MNKTKTVLKAIIAVLASVLLIYAILPKDTLINTLKKQIDEVSANHKYYQEQAIFWTEKEKTSKKVLNSLLDAYNTLNDTNNDTHDKTAGNKDFEAYAMSSELGRWQEVDDLKEPLETYFKGSVLEDKADELIEWCKSSSVPRVCVKLIAVKTQYETGKGTTGRGPWQKNLTGTTCSSSGKETFHDIEYSYKCEDGFRTYTQYYFALLDSVRLFVQGSYQDYFTLYGWPNGLKRFLNRWGGSIHYREILYDLNNW